MYSNYLVAKEVNAQMSFIIGGDFNATPCSFSYEVMKDGAFNMLHKDYKDVML